MMGEVLTRLSYLLLIGLIGCITAVYLYPRPYLKESYPVRAYIRTTGLAVWMVISLFFLPKEWMFIAGFVQAILAGAAFVSVTNVYYHKEGHPIIKRVVEHRFGFNSKSNGSGYY